MTHSVDETKLQDHKTNTDCKEIQKNLMILDDKMT